MEVSSTFSAALYSPLKFNICECARVSSFTMDGFKKPKRQLRGRTDDSAHESKEEHSSQKTSASDSTPPSTILSSTTTVTTTTTTLVTNKNKADALPKTLLSFADDEGDVEEFKINKSRESRKLIKEMKKQQQMLIVEEKPTTSVVSKKHIAVEENDEIEIKFKPLSVPKKAVESTATSGTAVNSFSSTHIELQRLRQEMKILNGQDAEEYDDETNDTGVMDETQRSVRLMLRSGNIPDPAMIHAARKRRQMAREMGNGVVGNDYITIGGGGDTSPQGGDSVTITSVKSGKSRLIREDENDGSDSEDEVVIMDRNKTRAANERQKNRDAFLELEQGSDTEDDEEFSQWEREQIRKGVHITQILPIKTNASTSSSLRKTGSNVSKTIVGYDPEPMEVEIRCELPPTELPTATFQSIRDKLNNILNSVVQENHTRKVDYEQICSAFEISQKSIQNQHVDLPQLELCYQFYQDLKLYTKDFIDCYNEKMPVIDSLEKRWFQLYKQRQDRLVSRRQEDVKDQCIEYPSSKAAAAISLLNTATDFRTPLDPKRQRRAVEREARRVRRRQAREDKNSNEMQTHFDGMSTDDEENPSDLSNFSSQKAEILSELEHILDDVTNDYCKYSIIKIKFEKWKQLYKPSYEEAWIENCLPKLFSPLIRIDMLDWNPTEASYNICISKLGLEGAKIRNKQYSGPMCKSIEDYSWYSELVLYGIGNEQDISDDQSVQLVPLIVEKIIIPKLTAIIENLYDPMSTKQTNALVKTIETLFQMYPTMNDESKAVQTLLKAIIDRLRQSLDDDIYIPIYPKQIISATTSSNRSVSGASQFFYRQYWTCVNLLGNILCWSNLLSIKTLCDLSIDGLLNRYILLALQSMDIETTDMTIKCAYIAKCFPKVWFNNIQTNSTLPALETFCRYLKQLTQEYAQQMEGATDQEKKQYRENIRQIRVIYLHLHALDHVLELSNQYDIK
ncbi:unnamed protein product [Didymodactylos carnosus]|uniref:GCF C-terminal domain-containing protein n=1 Tax=Didymodactylos carnosus TaxID=1234261 RepID=A0A814FM24_9BILA|nr:unnamed protein product [Didymodactylos carnosus]CAF0984856.1 unnamed protein product [Didymodactylos carnosus]CAF3631146.1 unnamed protein product [Didymodactylos carnosus]CAF3757140.1 unnamed protein product [Didymodactylos carnosus]